VAAGGLVLIGLVFLSVRCWEVGLPIVLVCLLAARHVVIKRDERRSS
jgi:hypothetical protein